MSFETISSALLLALLAAAAYTDLRARLIPNIIPVLVIALFAVALFFAPEAREFWPWRLASFTLALAIGLVLFATGVMGGGDVKLFAALALWHPFGELGMLAFFTAIAGAGVALFFAGIDFLHARIAATSDATLVSDLRKALKARIPYGVAILLGHLMVGFYGS